MTRIFLAAVLATFITFEVQAEQPSYPEYCSQHTEWCDGDRLIENASVPKKPEPRTIIKGRPAGFAQYCNENPKDSACHGGTLVSKDLWVRMMFDRVLMLDVLSSDTTEEGEHFRPRQPVLIGRAGEVEYWDPCAIARKNLLLNYYHLPFEKLLLATVNAVDGSARTVLLVDMPTYKTMVVDCEEDRVLSFEDFILEGNRLHAQEVRMKGHWGMDIIHAPEPLSVYYN